MRPIIDVFCHFLPLSYLARLRRHTGDGQTMLNRAAAMPLMVDPALRLEKIQSLSGLRQVLSLVSPPLDALASGSAAQDLALIANDAFAEMVAAHPDAYRGFVATVPQDDPEFACRELRRCVDELGACGVQLFSNVNGRAIDDQAGLSIIQAAAEMDVPIWLHPIRTEHHPDYTPEDRSQLELWWALGWPHETSLTMCRLAFAGIFDRWPALKVITHHGGGTIPFLAGRFDQGMKQLGRRQQIPAGQCKTAQPIATLLRKFYADSATFGDEASLACAAAFFGSEKMLFATDMPFGSSDGWSLVPRGIELVRNVFRDAADQDHIFSGNIESLLSRRPSTGCGTSALHQPVSNESARR